MRRLILLFVLLLPVASTAHDGPLAPGAGREGDNALFVNLTSDDPFRVWMALHFALQTRRMGHPVTVFLNVQGVRAADAKTPLAKWQGAQDAPIGYLRQIIAAGGVVLVCGPCLQPYGLAMGHLVPGVLPAGPGLTQGVLFAPGVKVMSW